MKLNKSGQLLLVSAASLAVATLMTACATLTVDFVYVSSARAAGANNYGEIDVFEVNSESGRMRQIPTSPFPSGGRNPVAEAVSSDFANLYVVNRDDNNIVQFIIGNDGKLYPQSTVNTPGVFPIATAVAGSNLFVADTYQPLPTCSTAAPCAGSVAVFPIAAGSGTTAGGGLGTAAVNTTLDTNYWPLIVPASTADVVVPVALAAPASGNSLYVAAYDSTANVGYVFAYAVSGGTLSPLNGGVPFAAGIHPSGIATDPTGAYIYVTDSSTASVLGFTASASGMTPMTTGSNGGNAFPAGNTPDAIVVNSAGTYAYVANGEDSTVTTYSISGGTLTADATTAVDTQPVAIGIEPGLNRYLYTANFLAGTVSGFNLNATNGSLINSQDSPSPSNANPTAVAAIPHPPKK